MRKNGADATFLPMNSFSVCSRCSSRLLRDSSPTKARAPIPRAKASAGVAEVEAPFSEGRAAAAHLLEAERVHGVVV